MIGVLIYIILMPPFFLLIVNQFNFEEIVTNQNALFFSFIEKVLFNKSKK